MRILNCDLLHSLFNIWHLVIIIRDRILHTLRKFDDIKRHLQYVIMEQDPNEQQQLAEHLAEQQPHVRMDVDDIDSDDDDSDEDYAENNGFMFEEDFDDMESDEHFSSDDDDDDDDDDHAENPADDMEENLCNQMMDDICQRKSDMQEELQEFRMRDERLYTFKPLKLIRINFKLNNARSGFPLARSGHRVIASESKLYSLGGYNPRSAQSARRRGQCVLFQELWCYNFATNRWSLMLDAENAANMPEELASNALVIHNNVLISHGGTGYPFGESCSNDCHVYTTGEKPLVTRLKVTGDLPTAQYGPGIVIHDDYLYTIGGTTGFDYSCDIYRLNLTTKVWENVYICRPEMRDDPEGRYRHEVVYDGQYIYVLGGGTSHSVSDLQRIPAFNLRATRWEYFDTLPDRSLYSTTNKTAQPDVGYPKPRKCFSCVQHTASNGDVEAFITGGMQADMITYFSDVWKLNLRTKQWSCIRSTNLPKPLYFHSAARANNGCMYIFGGIEYNWKEMRRRNHLYKMWMTIPKLSEMCWEAITFYKEHLHRYNRETLLKVGIPERFVNRVHALKQAPSGSTSNRDTQQMQVASCSGVSSKRLRSQSE